MFEYAGETAADYVDLTGSIEDWPEKQEDEIGLVYLSISGPYKISGGVWVAEGVGLYVSDYGGVLLISGIVWGRPWKCRNARGSCSVGCTFMLHAA